jgi:hypothetical protein
LLFDHDISEVLVTYQRTARHAPEVSNQYHIGDLPIALGNLDGTMDAYRLAVNMPQIQCADNPLDDSTQQDLSVRDRHPAANSPPVLNWALSPLR